MFNKWVKRGNTRMRKDLVKDHQKYSISIGTQCHRYLQLGLMLLKAPTPNDMT